MDKAKLHNFIREEIMKECELMEDLQKQIDYLKIVRHEYITNPPELDENYVKSPRLEVYLDEKIKLLGRKLEEKTKVKRKRDQNREGNSNTNNSEDNAKHFVNAFVKFHKNNSENDGIFTLRKLEEFSKKYLDHSSWALRYKDKIFWAYVDKDRVKKLDGKKQLSKETIEILGTKLQDFITKNEKKAITAKISRDGAKEKKTIQDAKYKEVSFSDLGGEEDDFLETYNDDESNQY